ncbi:MAG: ribosome biogenesis GTPase Der [Polyangiaceae bacterium]|nr:ribosome biogenesis GTPase Der [Polyangiaceae bacterium]
MSRGRASDSGDGKETIQRIHRKANAVVAIVGRPNVGKSTVFNRLVGKRKAIVHDEPGVTRDRHYSEALSLGRRYTIVDTGGFDPDSDDPMRQGISRQVGIAIEDADLIVCVFDASQGPTDADRQAVQMLRRSGRSVVYVANKVDSDRTALEANELYSLGVDPICGVSALHGRGFGELERALVEALPDESSDDVDDDGELIRVAVVGRPNAGKSSLVNRFAGEERALVDSRPGTTRDPVDLLVERDGRRFLFVDTAGIRRKSRVVSGNDAVEVVSVLRAMRAMEQAEVVVLMCDASIGLAEQDAKILGLADERGRGIVLAMNKEDQLDRREVAAAMRGAQDKLTFASWVPKLSVSAVTGRGTGALLRKIVAVRENFYRRVGTSELNRFFESVLQTHPPPTQGGKAPRLYYVTQAQTAPPLFAAMTNAPEAIHFSYQRYVKNCLRGAFDFEGVPIRVAYRARRRNEG